MNKILVVIPYLSKEAQGSELELAVAGWIKHFKTPHQVVIIGDWDEHVARLIQTPDVSFINCPRIQPLEDQYLPHLDIVHKFREVMRWAHRTDGFIYACDDMYAVKDFTIYDVKVPKFDIQECTIPEFDWTKESGWMRDLGKTRSVCWGLGKSTYNWVCHLPVWYDWGKLVHVLDTFNCDEISYVVENLYFNEIFPQRMYPCEPKYRKQVNTATPDFNSTDEVEAIWITNGNCGWSERLENILRQHYGQD